MSPNLIFITGATGYIGSHTVNSTLAAGHKVRLSIRRKEQEQDIQRWISGPQEAVEFAHIPDLTNPEAFKGHLDDVDYIFHLASPLPGKGEDVHKDYVDPAVDGTLAILKEAAKHERVKFVIVMSSVLGLLPIGAMAKPPVVPKGMLKRIRCTQVSSNIIQPTPTSDSTSISTNLSPPDSRVMEQSTLPPRFWLTKQHETSWSNRSQNTSSLPSTPSS